MENNGTNGDVNTDSDHSPPSVKQPSSQPLSTARKVIQLKIDNPLLTNGINYLFIWNWLIDITVHGFNWWKFYITHLLLN